MAPNEAGLRSSPVLWFLGRGRSAKWKEAEPEGGGTYRSNSRDRDREEASHGGRDEQQYRREEAPYKGRGAGDRRPLPPHPPQRQGGSWGSLFIVSLAMLVCLFTVSQLVGTHFSSEQCDQNNPLACFLRRWVLLAGPDTAPQPPQDQPQFQGDLQAQPQSLSQPQSQSQISPPSQPLSQYEAQMQAQSQALSQSQSQSQPQAGTGGEGTTAGGGALGLGASEGTPIAVGDAAGSAAVRSDLASDLSDLDAGSSPREPHSAGDSSEAVEAAEPEEQVLGVLGEQEVQGVQGVLGGQGAQGAQGAQQQGQAQSVEPAQVQGARDAAGAQLGQVSQQVPGQQVLGQAVPGQAVLGQQLPGQEGAGQAVLGQQLPGQQLPGQEVPGQQLPGQEGAGRAITDDRELFRRALEVTQNGGPCIAFLFMVRGPLPLAPLWARFFAGHEGKYSIYVHTMEGFQYKPEEIPPVFRGRQIHSKATKWGTITIIDAERRLLANALLDPRNTHFVLLSETCVPFFDFAFTHKYITGGPHSFLKTTASLNWWSQSMLPLVPEEKLRKGSAWFALQRRHAALVVADEEFYAQFARGWGFGHGFDEHYYQTLLTHLDPGGLANRSVMFAAFQQWKVHPIVYSFEDISRPFLQAVTNSTCLWKDGIGLPCYLFGRKFAAQTLDPLLENLPLPGRLEKMALPVGGEGAKEGGSQEKEGPGNVCTRESELRGRAVSRIHRGQSIAFLFLTRGQLPLAPLWGDFFAGQEGKYSIFIHSPLKSKQMDDYLPDVFRRRQIPVPEGAEGQMWEVGAVRRLLAHAMLDSKNSHFVLLSDTSIPVFGFDQTYKYIMESHMSFVEVNGKVTWWSNALLPRIPRDHLRRGASWFVMWRKHAALVLKDVQYCKSFLYGWGQPQGASEHYYQTFLSRLVAHELANRTLEYSEAQEGVAGGVRTFGAADVSESLIRGIKGRACTLAGAASPCFLFARQFSPEALEPLVRLLPVLGYGDTAQVGVLSPDKELVKEVGGVQQPAVGGPGRDLCAREQSLMRVVSRAPKGAPLKVAFLFLTRGGLPLAPLWAEFLAGGEGRFTVSVLTQDPVLFNEQGLPPIFQGRQVPSLNVETAGVMSEIFAVRRLMVHALLDPLVSHVVLLSEWCIPLYSFNYTYAYVTESQQSFLEVTRNTTWWGPSLLPRVPKDHLRQGSMFVALSRFHSFLILKDTHYCKAFVYGWGAPGAQASEHYYQTLLPRMVAPQLAYRGVLYEEILPSPQGADRIPRTFGPTEVTAELVRRMKEPECKWNAQRRPCFLFARQFGAECLEPLLAMRGELHGSVGAESSAAGAGVGAEATTAGTGFASGSTVGTAIASGSVATSSSV